MEETADEILKRHKQELKDFEKKGEKMRSFVPKKDRVGRQRVNDEVAALKEQLLRRHQQEREDAGIPAGASEAGTPVAEEENPKASPVKPMKLSIPNPKKKLSRAQERRKKKELEDRQAEERKALSRANDGPSEREVEKKKMDYMLAEKGLTVHEVAPDGNCLFSAVAHQLSLVGVSNETAASLRAKAADHIAVYKAEYMPFIEDVEGSDEKFDEYCNTLRTSTVWGGDVELRALAMLLEVKIVVFAVGLPLVELGEDASKETLRLSFHRKYYELGEHYNSVVPAQS